jgi:hypothetical protein
MWGQVCYPIKLPSGLSTRRGYWAYRCLHQVANSFNKMHIVWQNSKVWKFHLPGKDSNPEREPCLVEASQDHKEFEHMNPVAEEVLQRLSHTVVEEQMKAANLNIM